MTRDFGPFVTRIEHAEHHAAAALDAVARRVVVGGLGPHTLNRATDLAARVREAYADLRDAARLQ